MKKRIDVIPLQQVYGISFGAKREKVRQHFGHYTEFHKEADSSVTTDDFGFCHVFYNDKDEMEAVEFFADEVDVYIHDLKIFPIPLEEAIEIIPDAELDDDGLLSKTQSIGIYAPDEEAESILFGEKGYYTIMD